MRRRIIPLIVGISVPVAFIASLEAVMSSECTLAFALNILAFTLNTLATIGLFIRCWQRVAVDYTRALTLTSTTLASLLHVTCLTVLTSQDQYSNTCLMDSPEQMYSLLSALTTSLAATALWILAPIWWVERDISTLHIGLSDSQAFVSMLSVLDACYIVLGASLFSQLESWQFDKSVYFCATTLTTVGFGDMRPEQSVSLIVFPIYSGIGLVLFLATLACIRQVVLELLTLDIQAKVQQSLLTVLDLHNLQSYHNNAFQSEWSRLLSPISEMHATQKPVDSYFSPNAPIQEVITPTIREIPQVPMIRSQTVMDSSLFQSPAPMRHAQTITVNNNPRQTPGFRAVLTRKPTMTPLILFTPGGQNVGALMPPVTAADMEPNHTGRTISLSRIFPFLRHRSYTEEEDDLENNTFTNIEACRLLSAIRKSLRRQLKGAAGVMLSYLMLFSASMMLLEGLSWFHSLYFSFGVMTTIGMGDLTPQTLLGRNVFLVFVMVGVGTLTYVASVVGEVMSNQWRIHIENTDDDQNNSETHTSQ